MPCEKTEKTCQTTNQKCCNKGINDYLIIIVLYILLAIIISACLNF